MIIEQVQHEILEAPVTVYNFEVEDFHTYYVGSEPVLVHNKCSQDNPLSDIKYTDKVQAQMNLGDDHGFPSIVDNYGSYGQKTTFQGGDGMTYTKVEIYGSYNGKSGVFEYIYDSNNVCNHRFFRRN